MKKLLILAFLLLGCFSMASYAAKPKAKHVVYIGLDGWGSYSMPKANMPTVKSLMETGCYTMQKRTVLPSSSAVNWASMFMGAGPEVHGYTEWGFTHTGIAFTRNREGITCFPHYLPNLP